MITGQREAELLEAANTLLNARRDLRPIAALPASLAPVTDEEASYIQTCMAESYGTIGGWKVGAADATGTPQCAPMPAAWMGPDNSRIFHGRLRGVEAEVAFLLGADLPVRAAAYAVEDVLAAIASCHPGAGDS